MEEERARQEAAAKKAAEEATAAAAAATSAGKDEAGVSRSGDEEEKSAMETEESSRRAEIAGAAGHHTDDDGTTTMDTASHAGQSHSAMAATAEQDGPTPMDEETALLQQALALSMGETSAAHADISMAEVLGDNTDLALALQLSLQGEAGATNLAAAPNGAAAATGSRSGSSTTDMTSAVLGDAAFMSSVLASLPGVDPNDPSVRDLLAALQPPAAAPPPAADQEKPANESDTNKQQ
eukprot:TRINITY_DN2185_c0_g1_i5.p1 TRINITY_DN2185_c0_g1~~TRINITY_DN2185_c0_g1_i5.p1  ORF type:complete len:269 (+),score=126.96 TRINITY_DN2185_c0_g1_i5:94-807(+)